VSTLYGREGGVGGGLTRARMPSFAATWRARETWSSRRRRSHLARRAAGVGVRPSVRPSVPPYIPAMHPPSVLTLAWCRLYAAVPYRCPSTV
jgi:hypothetical protein